jgi:peptidyl-prolyl cis-trans isomerase B (cyclophilin B)
MKNILKVLLALIVFVSCNSKNDENIYRDIKNYEFSRNPDTTYFSGLISIGDNQQTLEMVKSIGRIANESYLPLLQQLLSSNSIEIQKETIFSIGQIGTPECEVLMVKYFNKPGFSKYQKNIILALGRCADKSGSAFLLKQLKSFDDSLKVTTIQNLAYIFKRNNKLNAIPDTVNSYLNHRSKMVQFAAIYFFNRNFYLPAYYNVINTNAPISSNTYKYKLNVISKILEKHAPDSLMLDSLNTTLINNRFYKEPDWKKLIYKIKILTYYPDSLTTTKIASYLKNENPHVRKEAIVALGKIQSDFSKNKLLQYYDQTNWAEKGLIILNLAERYPKFIYRLIQQNLDQGSLYFKELLLQSLAKINSRDSRTQLKQFLNVPEPRLQATAFQELEKLRRLSYKDAQMFLQSGNKILTLFAAYWISEHPKHGKFEDLISAYSKFSEPQNVETMVTIIEAINKLNLSQSIAFLDSIYLNTAHPDIAKAAAEGLSHFDIGTQEKDFSGFSLFIPDSLIFASDPVNITIKTEKGDIEIELWPQDSPLTVSHFINLAVNGYYNDQLFHRVVADFVIQVGNPTGTGWGGPGYSIPCEYNDNPYIRGSVGLATAGKDTGGSQFFICHSELPHLNRRYTNFGIVKKGMEIVDQITKDDKILNIAIN